MARRLLLLFFVLALTVAASATRIQISEPPCTPNDTDVPASAINNFGPFVPINGGGQFGFCNKTGQDWTSILIAIRTSLDISQIECVPGAFLACIKSTTPAAPGVDYLYFLGTPGNPQFGIPFFGVKNNERFTVNLDCAPGDICLDPPLWPDDTVIYGYGNIPITAPFPIPPASTPEPATLALLSTGLAAGIWRRKRSA